MEGIIILAFFLAVIVGGLAGEEDKRSKAREQERQKSISDMPPAVRDAVQQMDAAGKNNLQVRKTERYYGDGIEVTTEDTRNVHVRRRWW